MFSERTTLQRLLLLKALSGGGQSLVERTAIGNPLTFGTDVSKALKSLLIPFTPVQSGTGDPSPQNVRNIIPWNGLTVFGGGKNLIDDSKKYQHSTTTVYIGENSAERNIFLKAGKYTVTRDFGGKTIGLYYAKRDSSTEKTIFNAVSTDLTKTITISEDGYYAIFCYRSGSSGGVTVSDIISVMIEVGETATAYVPYKPITETDISFPSPVYGGEHEVVSGELKSVYASDELTGLNVASYGTASTGVPYVRMTTQSVIKNNGNVLCDSYKTLQSVPQQGNSGCRLSNQTLFIYDDRFTSESVAKELLTANPIQCVYELAKPQEIQLTPTQLTALIGNNTIWSDADGQMTAVYLVSSKYAEDHPVGGLGSGLGSGLLGSGTEDNPEDPADDPIEDPEEEIPDNTEEGSESDD